MPSNFTRDGVRRRLAKIGVGIDHHLQSKRDSSVPGAARHDSGEKAAGAIAANGETRPVDTDRFVF